MADAVDLRRLEALFQGAADLPAGERGAFLERACGDDAALRTRLDALLAQLDHGGSLAPPAFETEPASEGPGTSIDRYKILQTIGEGGFGVVYMAEQEEPVRRRVALKVIKLGMDTREVVARFEAERQALAMMDHPNIARVLDGGATPSGRPFFVMELVRGVSITEYCDKNSTPTRGRLELFAHVCDAVQHAHQKGVIHRDIKPTNVMVTLHDGRPVVKVIDFGVAKAMHTRLTEKTLFTRYERFIGTPAYMSPEQAELSGLDVDTRTDIYALGVLLYELLTGTTPFDSSVLLDGGLAEMQRVIREQPPERPSSRISTTVDATVAASRGADVGALSKTVRGDLDWIVLKAIEKDRSRRYGTASALADDVRRHLAHEPVLAGPPSAVYRTRKFLQRNRAAVGSALAVLLALAAAFVGIWLAMLEASRQRDDAVGARIVADQKEAQARAVTDFLVATIGLTDPEFARAPDMSVRELLDMASLQVAEAFEGQPLPEARVRTTIGQAYLNLAENELCEAHLRRAIELFDEAGPEEYDPFEYYTTCWSLTQVAFRLQRDDSYGWARRSRLCGHAIVRERFPELADVLDGFMEWIEKGSTGGDPEPLHSAMESFPDVARAAHETLAPGDPLWPIITDSFSAAGYSLWYTPSEPLSVPIWEEIVRIRQAELPPSDPTIGEAVAQLVGVLNRLGRPEEAEQSLRDVIDALDDVFGPDAFQLAFCRSMLGEALLGQGRYEEAEPHLVESHVVIAATTEGFYTVDSVGRLARLYAAWGKPERAKPYRDDFARILSRERYPSPWMISRTAYGPEHGELVAAMERASAVFNAAAYGIRGVPFDALAPAVEEAAELVRALPPDHDLVCLTARQFVFWAVTIPEGTLDDVRVRMVETALPLLEPFAGEVPLVVAEGNAVLSSAALARGELAVAARLARESSRLLGEFFGGDSWMTAVAKVRVARCLAEQRLFDDAEALLLPALDVIAAQLGDAHSETGKVRAALRELYGAWGKPGEAERYAD